jgi:hypothetical protein
MNLPFKANMKITDWDVTEADEILVRMMREVMDRFNGKPLMEGMK